MVLLTSEIVGTRIPIQSNKYYTERAQFFSFRKKLTYALGSLI